MGRRIDLHEPADLTRRLTSQTHSAPLFPLLYTLFSVCFDVQYDRARDGKRRAIPRAWRDHDDGDGCSCCWQEDVCVFLVAVVDTCADASDAADATATV